MRMGVGYAGSDLLRTFYGAVFGGEGDTRPMIQVANSQIIIDGTPRVIMCGEVHYFRLARHEWAGRLASLKAAGCTAVASYIPWLWHELPDGTLDVSGATRPERDVAAFIDLCHEHGLWFLARPGPFVMAEMKNEGLPYRLYTEHPEIIPPTWDGRPVPTRTVDYLAPAYLAEVRRWYDAVLPPIAERQQPRGGNVIAVQLDNEVGMLSWVSNSPDLTDGLLTGLLDFARERHGDRLPARYPLDLADPAAWARAVRSPAEQWAAALRADLGAYTRRRFARYIATLREYAEAAGVREVPFAVNVHGTADGDGAPFPIGISQLSASYRGVPGVIAGSDHYLGDMTPATTTDLYVMNAYLRASQDAGQPLTSLEFEAGSGDYGGDLDRDYDPTSVELKTRLFAAQGNRLINYYLFTGGVNPPLDVPVGDGNDRIAFTGERHGTAAPIDPEGHPGLTYAPLSRAVAAIRANEPWLARMNEEHDDLALGFVPDAYLTEYHHPASAIMREVTDDLTTHRGAGPRKALARSLLSAGYRFGAVDLQDESATWPRVIVLATGRHLAAAVQRRLAAHVETGGGLLLFGPLPDRDLDAWPCTVLADALGLTGGRLIRGSHRYYPSVTARDWAAPRAETRVTWLQELQATTASPVLVDVATGSTCGVEVSHGRGRAVVWSLGLAAEPGLFRAAATRLGAAPGLTHDTSVPALVATTTADPDGGRLVHVLNILAGYTCATRLCLDGDPLFGGHELTLPPRTGLMLPLGLRLEQATVLWSTTEITGTGERSVSFAAPQGTETILLRTTREISGPCDTRRDGDLVTVTARHPGPLALTFT
jgi:beta-galactosidase